MTQPFILPIIIITSITNLTLFHRHHSPRCVRAVGSERARKAHTRDAASARRSIIARRDVN